MQLLEADPGGRKVSASQIKLFSRCPRAWWYTYPGGHRAPSSPAQELGTAVHAQAQAWLERGEMPNLAFTLETPKGPRYPGRIFQPALPLLPVPQSGLCEMPFWLEISGVVLHGYLDWIGSNPGETDRPNRSRIHVVDHKTTTDFRWMYTLEDDPAGSHICRGFCCAPRRSWVQASVGMVHDPRYTRSKTH